jgi:hypothetical protein
MRRDLAGICVRMSDARRRGAPRRASLRFGRALGFASQDRVSRRHLDRSAC